MKKSLLLFSWMLFSQVAQAERERFVCSLMHAKRVMAIAQKHSDFDKNRHCSVSCMLALKCNDSEVLMVGMLKEFKDLLGPGDADTADIEANITGIALASKGAAWTDGECLSSCDLYFSP